MKNYTITVNGNVYDVTVEESGSTMPSAPKAAPAAPKAAPAAPKAAPAAPKAAPAAPAASTGSGNIQVKAGAAGKIFKIEVSVGQHVNAGDAVVIIEAMKMEIPVVAPEAGTVASIDVAVGEAIESGAILATLN